MPTIIGVVFFCCGVYCFFFDKDGLFGLLIIASLFQAASAINIAERGIQPYYVIAVLIIVRALCNWLLGVRTQNSMQQPKWILLFGFIAISSAFVFPIIFAGTPVYDPKIGIDEVLLIRPPLHFGLNNVAQAFFLACHIATAYAVVALDLSSRKARRAYVFAFYLVVVIIGVQAMCQIIGIPFPHSLIRNNPGYALQGIEDQVNGTRNPGTFTEPSAAGAFLALYCIGFLAEYFAGAGRALRVVASLVASALVASSGSLLTISLSMCALFIRRFPFRFPWYLNL